MPDKLVVEIFGHMDAGDRTQWTEDQDLRPLSELGRRQAERLCEALATQSFDALYSSPAMRARQTLEPLAGRFELPITPLEGLRETDGWQPPPLWRDGRAAAPDPIGGAYAAGRAMQALEAIRAEHRTGRVAACSHGDILPALIVYLIGAFELELPAPLDSRGGWYTLSLDGTRIDVEHHDRLPGFPS